MFDLNAYTSSSYHDKAPQKRLWLNRPLPKRPWQKWLRPKWLRPKRPWQKWLRPKWLRPKHPWLRKFRPKRRVTPWGILKWILLVFEWDWSLLDLWSGLNSFTP